MKTIKLIRVLIVAVISCIGFSNCSSDPIAPEIIVEMGYEDYFAKNMDFDSSAGEKSFSFNSNVDWTIDVAATRNGTTWCTVTPNSGKAGANTVRIKVQENTSYDDRSVVLTLTAGSSLTKTITITQKQINALLLTTNKFEVDPKGGKINVEVKSNIEYDVIIPEAYKSWISQNSDSRVLSTSNLSFDIKETEETDKREGEIIIKSGELTETIHIYQTGQNILLLSKNQYPVIDKGETIAVEIKSNFSFNVQMPNVDWIIEDTESRGVSSHTLYYTILPNETYDSRKADIVFYDKNSELKDTLEVVQAQKGALVITQKEYHVEAEGETIKVKFNTNVDYQYTLLDSCNWIKAIDDDSRALQEYELSFSIDENWSGSERNAKIVIYNSTSSVSDTIVVYQNTIPDNEIWYRTNDGLIWDINVGEVFNNTYIKGKGVISYNTPIREIKDLYWSQSSNMTNTLIELVLPNSLTYIGSGAFGCTGLKKVTIPASVKVIGDNAFYECKELKEITFMNGLEEIEHSAFHSCSSLINVKFPATFKILGKNAFGHCSAIETIYVDEDNPYLSSLDGILYDKEQTKLIRCPIPKKSVEIPLTVKTIGQSAFTECEYLKEIIVPNSVTTIENNAFYNCNSLESILIPSSVQTIGDSFVGYCEKLDAIIVDSNNSNFSSLDGILYNKDQTSLLTCPVSKSNISIPSSVTTIGNYAFNGCSNLGEITLPNNLTIISDGAFQQCDSITSLVIPDKVTTIGNLAFASCRNLEEIIIPDNVTNLGTNAFQYCVSLKSVGLSKNIKEIGTYTFFNCYNLTEFIIPDGVVSIGEHAFRACYKLVEIKIPNSMEIVKDYAFQNCRKLKSLTFPENVSYIGSMVVYGCENISEIYCKAIYPPNIDMSAFYNNKAEPKIYVPRIALSAYKTAYNWERYANNIEGYDY